MDQISVVTNPQIEGEKRPVISRTYLLQGGDTAIYGIDKAEVGEDWRHHKRMGLLADVG